MIQISTKSWHYKLTTSLAPYYPTSLCSYMRWAFMAVLAVGVMVTGVGVLVTCMTIAALNLLGLGPYILDDGLGVVGGMGWAFAAFVGGEATWRYISDKLHERKLRRAGLLTAPRRTHLLTEWIRAKKKKLCPLVEYVSDKGG